MNWISTVLLLLVAFVAVFIEAAVPAPRHWLGAQIDLLPPLMVYAGLSLNLGSILALGLCGGLWFDSLSANPLGVSVLPLILVGASLYAGREFIWRDQTFAHVAIGFAASVVTPVISLLVLFTTAQRPLFGWGTLWQLLVMGIGGALATPVCFFVFGWLHHLLGPVRVSEASFRPDREIRRGK